MLTKKNLNPNIKLVEGNTKLKNTDKKRFLIWNITSQETCPFSTPLCRKKCYAKNDERLFKLVHTARSRHLHETQKPTFEIDMIKHIEYQLSRKVMQGKQIYFRIHESGDFFDENYTDKFVRIAEHFKDRENIIFQAYTKSLMFFRKYDLDKINIKVVFSVWDDTPAEALLEAKNRNMQTFTAVPNNRLESVTDYICPLDCADCSMCYSKQTKPICVPYHGPHEKTNKPYSLRYFKPYKERIVASSSR